MAKTFIFSIIDSIAFKGNIKTNQKLVHLNDTLEFQWIFWDVQPAYFNKSDFVAFVQHVGTSGVKRHISITHHLSLNHKLKRIIEKTIIDTLLLSQPKPPIKDKINFTETVIINNSTPINDTLFLIQFLTYTRNLHFFINDRIIFRDNSHGWKIPFKGRVSDQIYTDPIVINHRTEVTFRQSDGNVFALFRPSFGNEYKTQFNHIQKESRGKSLILAGNNTYPYIKSIKSLHMIFEYMKQQEGASFMAFLNNNLGLPITIEDHEGISFNGIITSPELELVQQDKNNFSTSFDFEIIPS